MSEVDLRQAQDFFARYVPSWHHLRALVALARSDLLERGEGVLGAPFVNAVRVQLAHISGDDPPPSLYAQREMQTSTLIHRHSPYRGPWCGRSP